MIINNIPTFLMANESFLTPELLTGLISSIVTGGLTFLGVIVVSRKDKSISNQTNDTDLTKSFSSSAIDLLELNTKEIEKLREELKASREELRLYQEKYDKLFADFQEQKIQINNLIKKCEDLQNANTELQQKNQELLNRIDALENIN